MLLLLCESNLALVGLKTAERSMLALNSCLRSRPDSVQKKRKQEKFELSADQSIPI
jgi:hypothetical protein